MNFYNSCACHPWRKQNIFLTPSPTLQRYACSRCSMVGRSIRYATVTLRGKPALTATQGGESEKDETCFVPMSAKATDGFGRFQAQHGLAQRRKQRAPLEKPHAT